MEPSFWHDRWQENRIGFHQPEVNRFLVQYADRWQIAPGDQVFVPLCGKSLDMIWLQQQGYRVLGSELSEVAAGAFFAEQNRQPCVVEDHGMQAWSSGDTRILVGDFFDLGPEHTREVAAVYDRAALIALPPDMRRRYAQHMAELLPSGVRMLLLTLEYPPGEISGPPFSVSGEEVEQLFGDRFGITLLAGADRLQESDNLRERGVSRLGEQAYLLQKL